MQSPDDRRDDDLRSILDAFRHIVHATRAFSSEAEEKVGLTAAQLFALQVITRHGPLSVNQLAALTLTHQSSVSVVVRRLVEKGLVEKQPSAEDRRQVQLSPTKQGKALAGKSPNVLQDRLIDALHALTPTEQHHLAALLSRVVSHMAPDGRTPPMFFSEEPEAEDAP